MKLIKVFCYCFILIVVVSFFDRNWKVNANSDEYFRFDEYNKLSFKDEKARLDNLSRFMLQEEPTFIAYIIAYNGKNSCKNEAHIRARRANDYILNKHKISAERIVIGDGGYREKLTFEFYVSPKDAPSPKGSPTLEENEVKIIGNCKTKGKL